MCDVISDVVCDVWCDQEVWVRGRTWERRATHNENQTLGYFVLFCGIHIYSPPPSEWTWEDIHLCLYACHIRPLKTHVPTSGLDCSKEIIHTRWDLLDSLFIAWLPVTLFFNAAANIVENCFSLVTVSSERPSTCWFRVIISMIVLCNANIYCRVW